MLKLICLLIIHIILEYILHGESWFISSLICIHVLWINFNYLSLTIKLDSHRGARARKRGERAILRAIDEGLENIGRPIVLRESKSPWEGLAHRISRDKSKGFNQPAWWGKNEDGRLVSRLHSSRSYCSQCQLLCQIVDHEPNEPVKDCYVGM